ncbi:NAD(P)/FAD-dependent oxidoreductase [Streptomyces sp. NPDC002054]|uniref:NAD(P)/FAD-dependent oxidoreductase n=1 Tax=Streptomyces sp. NPDC002054 TaxID=3154663 RepID=UPI0033239335
MTHSYRADEAVAAADAEVEVLVVGGGAAGLGGALILARARRSVLVLDSGSPRNAPAGHMHGYPGFDGANPAELLARARAEAAAYGVRFAEAAAIAADRLPDGGFLVRCDDGSSVRAARLLVATGLVDVLPELPGLAGRWGRDVLHCPYCHGWEVRDRPLAVLATGPAAVQQAQLWRQWSDRITLLRNGTPLTGEQYEELAARGIAVADAEATGLRLTQDDRLTGVELADGTTVACEALVVAPRFAARAAVLSSLGLPLTEVVRDGRAVGTVVDADPHTGATALPGVWAAGNVTAPFEKVVGAAAQGVRAATAINADLIAEEIRRATEARRRASATPAAP